MLFYACPNAFSQASLPPPDVALPPINQWTVGGKLTVSPTPTGFRLAVPPDGDWGHVWVEGEADLDATPYVALWITEVGYGAQWQLSANDPAIKSLEPGAEDVGLAVYDLRAKTGWHGRKRFRLYLTVQGRDRHVVVAGAGLYSRDPSPENKPLRWTRMNSSVTPFSPVTGSIDMTLNPSGADQWGGLTTRLPVDVDRNPFIETTVAGLAPDARWRIALDHAAFCSGAQSRNNGTVAVNYRDFTAWRGATDVDVQVIFLRVGGKAAGTVSDLRFVPYPTASAALVGAASHIGSRMGKPLLRTGHFDLTYDPSAGVFRLEREGGDGALITRFLEMPGFDLTPPVPLAVEPIPTGQRLQYQCASWGANFRVTVETASGLPGLFHATVAVTPTRDLHLSSCGHEWAYVQPGKAAPAVLQRWATQNLSATGLSYVTAPGVGRVFYMQDLTALNPLLDACGISPRWLVSASDVTFGFADPLDTGRTFQPGQTFILSDSYLYLAAEADHHASTQREPQEPITIADGFLKGMGAAYEAMPDTVETQWVDWPGLAETSVHDLLSGDCWRDYGGQPYLQSYVGVHGSSPQLAGMQDVYAPLLGYHPASPQAAADRDTILGRFRSAVPSFWSDAHGTFREGANGDHSGYDIPFQVTLARAALGGEGALRDRCLRSAEKLMRLAADTHDTFIGADIDNNCDEMPGTYLLYMMQCYAMDPQAKYLAEAKRIAGEITTWSLDGTHEIYWTAMTCEGLARLYDVTKDAAYVRTSEIPLARLMRNARFWRSDYGLAGAWDTFGGLNPDATGIDYVAPMEQYQSWHALRQYYLLTKPVLPSYVNLLVSELIRHIPMTVWYAYPSHLPVASLHTGEAFWKTDNNYKLAIPVEDLNDGWSPNGAVGQELYGAGACFGIVDEAYMPVPDAGCTLFSEYPILSSQWDAAERVLTLRLGGSSHHRSKIEISGRPGPVVASSAAFLTPALRHVMDVNAVSTERFRFEAPGDSLVRIRFATPSRTK